MTRPIEDFVTLGDEATRTEAVKAAYLVLAGRAVEQRLVLELGNNGAKASQFRRLFGRQTPTLPSPVITNDFLNTVDYLDEERRELNDAIESGDSIEILDALADITYLCYQAAATFGVNLDVILHEVHASNMTKLDSDGKPIYRAADNKVMKSANYIEPNIPQVLGLRTKA